MSDRTDGTGYSMTELTGQGTLISETKNTLLKTNANGKSKVTRINAVYMVTYQRRTGCTAFMRVGRCKRTGRTAPRLVVNKMDADVPAISDDDLWINWKVKYSL